MMNDPFFRNYSKQQPWSSSRSVPVQQTQKKPSPKIISVPVHFISSDQPPTTISMSKDSAAVKIQKLFRGFVVRKSVKKIVSIRNEVVEIERRIEDSEVVDLIRKDAKERLRVNETLMSLLFKLDSIRGVDSGVRDLRKAVTKKAIALQEKVDSIGQVDNQTLGLKSPGEIDPNNVCANASDAVDEIVNIVNNNSEAVEDDETAMEASPAVNFGENDDTAKDVQKHDCVDYAKGNRAILESLMDDNEKLKRLMTQISERNEMQTRMINSLSRRVEQLEKAEKLRKNKRKHVSVRKRDKDSLCI